MLLPKLNELVLELLVGFLLPPAFVGSGKSGHRGFFSVFMGGHWLPVALLAANWFGLVLCSGVHTGHA